jgi:hypothetical protein
MLHFSNFKAMFLQKFYDELTLVEITAGVNLFMGGGTPDGGLYE